jgi:capsular polysaccharide biosynthesis protein
MAVAIDSRPVAKETIRRLGSEAGITPDELLDNLSSRTDEDTMLFQLTYTATDPARAKDVVGTVGQVASERISNNKVTAVVWRKAKASYSQVIPKPLRNGLIALVATLALSVALIAAREYLRR